MEYLDSPSHSQFILTSVLNLSQKFNFLTMESLGKSRRCFKPITGRTLSIVLSPSTPIVTILRSAHLANCSTAMWRCVKFRITSLLSDHKMGAKAFSPKPLFLNNCLQTFPSSSIRMIKTNTIIVLSFFPPLGTKMTCVLLQFRCSIISCYTLWRSGREIPSTTGDLKGWKVFTIYKSLCWVTILFTN